MTTGPDTLHVRTPDNVAIHFPAAGLGTRLIAQLVDSCVIGLILLVVAVLVSAFAASAVDEQAATMVFEAGIASSLLLYVAYFTISEAVGGGRTLGKAATHIRVVRTDGGAPGIPEILIRNLARLIDMLLGIGIFFMFFHPLSRRLGDLAAGTLVVRDQSAAGFLVSPARVMTAHATEPYAPIAGLEQLGQREYGVLRDFMIRRGLAPEQRARVAAALAQRIAERMELPVDGIDRQLPAELFLERVYLQLGARDR